MSLFERIWQRRGLLAGLLLPIAMFYGFLVALHRLAYTLGLKRVEASALPVVVVGNISVGGTGKSPLTQALVREFQALGWRPGIVSRGYGGKPQSTPQLVGHDSSAAEYGDEPVMHARSLDVPVCVCAHRALAVAHLAAHTDVTLVLADDGLQHHAMARDIEIAVVDADRGLGNGWLLPAGRLRESRRRLLGVDLVAVQVSFMRAGHPSPAGGAAASADGHPASDATLAVQVPGLEFLTAHASPVLSSFFLQPANIVNLDSGEATPMASLGGRTVHAVAGVGYPQRFFDSLTAAGLQVTPHAMTDHHVYSADDVLFDDLLPVLVTSKDAVKIRQLPTDLCNLYEVRVNVQLSESLTAAIASFDQQLRQPSTHAPEHHGH